MRRRTRELLRLAQRAGWRAEPTNGGHLRLDHPDAAGPVFASSTPSGGRWRQNAMADLRRVSAAVSSAVTAAAPWTGAAHRLDPDLTQRFGCPELHGLYFQHRDDRGSWCSTVMIMVPEASRREIKAGLAWARAKRARVAFTTDTSGQALQMYELARRLLPDHRHVAMQRAEAGAWGQLS